MCGLVALLARRPVDAPATVRRMLDRIRHRGPDGEGTARQGPVLLGHRRLAILDPEGGAQPMVSRDGRATIAFNGEIYNYRALRRELEQRGCTFRTASDTEVLLEAWRTWREGCLPRLRGMFAFAVADEDERSLFLARDGFGIKPLHHAETDAGFAAASELSAFREVGEGAWTLDPVALDAYLALGYVPAPQTMLTGIRKLEPGHWLRVGFDGRVGTPVRWWSPVLEPGTGPAPGDLDDRLDAALRDSVDAHLVADVPFGALLSGGLDSSAVVERMAAVLPGRVRTFSIRFEETEYDESPWARAVAEHIGTDHHERTVRPDAAEVLPQLVRHHGEPFADSSAIPTWYVCQLAREHVPMVLSGDGGDETLAGYGRYLAWPRWLRPGRPRRPAWKRLARAVARPLAPGLVREDVLARTPRGRDWLPFVGLASDGDRDRLWRAGLRPTAGRVEDRWDEAAAVVAGQHPDEMGRQLDLLHYLPGDVLTKVDVASMAHGLEVRVPFLDREVFELAAHLPSHRLVQEGPDGLPQGKAPLRRLLRRSLPARVVDRPKMGFRVPLARWLAPGGALRSGFEERVLAPGARMARCLRPEGVRDLLAEHDRGVDRSGLLWAVLVLEAWLEAWSPRVGA